MNGIVSYGAYIPCHKIETERLPLYGVQMVALGLKI